MGEERIVPERRKSTGWRKYAGYGVTAFLVIAAAVILIFMFVRMEQFSEMLDKLGSALAPVIFGLVFAYLMNPLMMFFERRFKPVFYKHAKRISRAKRAVRVVSIVFTLMVTFLGLCLIGYMLVPELTKTTADLIDILPGQTDRFMEWFDKLMVSETKFGSFVKSLIEKITSSLNSFLSDDLFDYALNSLGLLASGVMNVMEVLYNVVLGFVFSVYFLSSKETLVAQMKKILYAFLKRKKANSFIRVARECHAKFTNCITGKIVDSALVGIICFAGMLVMDIHYSVLISVIVGVTNVIPFFGPYIGALPSAFLLLMVDPIECLTFLIFIIILQQFDCNLFTPKIVGESIGLSPFWVLFACVVFGALFGLVGMLLGVPCMACVYMIIKEWIEGRLKHKGLHTETEEYAGIDSVDEHEMVLVERYNDPEKITVQDYEQQIAAEKAENDEKAEQKQ